MSGRELGGKRGDRGTARARPRADSPAAEAGVCLPDCIQDAIGQYIARKTGKEIGDPVLSMRLRKAIVAQKDDYWKPQADRALQYTKGYSVLGYLVYHFPVYYLQVHYLMAMLAADGLLKERMAILDAGTGPGVVPLAIAEYYARQGGRRADVFSIERSEEHIEAFLHLRDSCVPKGGPVSIKPPLKYDITGGVPEKVTGPLDLIIFSNVLNEVGEGSMERRADLVMRYAERLAPDGSILIIEPAEENTSTRLRVLALALKKRGLTIHSPCTFIHGTNCTPGRCWSFVEQPRVRPTRLMDLIAGQDEPYRYLNTDIKYSYVVLRKDTKTRSPFRVPAGSRVMRLSQVHRHVEKRVNTIAAKMSGNLGDAQTLVFRLCDGSCEKPVFAVLPAYHVTPENEALVSAPYGAVLDLESVLIRKNEKHDAYNVLVSRNSRVAYPEQDPEE